jgi:hypothetical protein
MQTNDNNRRLEDDEEHRMRPAIEQLMEWFKILIPISGAMLAVYVGLVVGPLDEKVDELRADVKSLTTFRDKSESKYENIDEALKKLDKLNFKLEQISIHKVADEREFDRMRRRMNELAVAVNGLKDELKFIRTTKNRSNN